MQIIFNIADVACAKNKIQSKILTIKYHRNINLLYETAEFIIRNVCDPSLIASNCHSNFADNLPYYYVIIVINHMLY